MDVEGGDEWLNHLQNIGIDKTINDNVMILNPIRCKEQDTILIHLLSQMRSKRRRRRRSMIIFFSPKITRRHKSF
jgi:hypothetical protein